ncbi:MAG: hypothetical protein WEE89_18165, partial [Gemmatimonadota bacterium]
MQAYRPDRVVRALTTIVTIAYFGLWVGAVLALTIPPAVKLFPGDASDRAIGLPVPATLKDFAVSVQTRWGPAQLAVTDVRADLELPGGMLPWWLIAVVWAHVALSAALMLLSAHQLRRIFQR